MDYNGVLKNVVFKDVGRRKISVLKAARELTGLGLKETKNLIDSAPCVLLKNVPLSFAEEAKEFLEAQGAVVEID